MKFVCRICGDAVDGKEKPFGWLTLRDEDFYDELDQAAGYICETCRCEHLNNDHHLTRYVCTECEKVEYTTKDKPADWLCITNPDNGVHTYICDECNIKRWHPVEELKAVDEETPVKSDMVDSPYHYANVNNVECIYWIREGLNMDEYRGYIKGNILKYIWRYDYKGEPIRDLEKARKYLDFLIEEIRLRRDEEDERSN